VLGALEEKRRADPLVVIGVHSAKFDAEKAPDRIADAMARYGVRHPVVVDDDHRVWQSYAVRSWPTLVVVRPDGTIAAVAPGEADLDSLDAFVEKVLADARADGTLARAPLRFDAALPEPPGVLSFPGKVAAVPGGLAVSDSGHHRVLVLDLEGRVRTVAGSGEAGLSDGPLTEARFSGPQGLAFDAVRNLLFVADTGNHALRAIDLGRRTVRTLAGTGERGHGVPRGALPGREIALRSPWDLTVAGDYVLVAMAGTHQIWTFDQRAGTMSVLAGSGREALEDGPFATAAFAQPSGLALADERLYVADSETSAVRYLDLVRGEVRTLVGKGLFDFGDRDGPASDALLQHPLAVAYGPRGLVVADTYNDKIKSVDEESGAVRTLLGVEAGGLTLREPSGVCALADGRLVVADTSHHRLVVVTADGAARVLEITGAVGGDPGATRVPAGGAGAEASAETLFLAPLTVGLGDVTLRLRIEPPAGFDMAAGSRVAVRLAAGPPLAAPGTDQGFLVSGGRPGVPILLRSGPEPGESDVAVSVEAVVCRHGDAAACFPVRLSASLAVRVAADGPAAATATLVIPPPA
jgi:DNA-binding beta-propeller fold protein YncE